MTPSEVEADLRADFLTHAGRGRGSQTETGASQVYGCVAAAMFRLRAEPTEPRLSWQAEVGSAVHARIAAARTRPGVLTEQRMMFRGVWCTVDFIDTERGILIDWKTKDGAAEVRAAEAQPAQVAQIMLGAAAAREAGIDVREVALAFLPRSGDLTVKVIGPWPYDEARAVEAAEWVADVDRLAASDVDPREHRGEPAWWCRAHCSYVAVCRGPAPEQPDLSDLELPARRYREAADARDEAEAVMRGLRPVLHGVTGVCGTVQVTSTYGRVTETVVPDVDAMRETWEWLLPDVPVPTRVAQRSSGDRLIVRWSA